MTERRLPRPIVDTHAHLDFAQFDADRPAVMERAARAGVAWIVNPGADLESSQRAVALAQEWEQVYAAVGIHPHEARTVTDESLERLGRLAASPKVVAIGEIGLDYYRDLSPREQQRRAFQAQLQLAERVQLPVIVHDREAHEDVLAILKDWASGPRRLRGVFHAFSGDEDVARRAIELGFYIGLGGPVTFQNARRLGERIVQLPLERVVFETDCPYLAPHPYRGQRNEPAYVRFVVQRLAELRGLSVQDVESQTTRNAAVLFRSARRTAQGAD